MDSINKNQPEHNRDDLHGLEAIKRIKKTVDVTDTCFFVTEAGNGNARPMAVRKVDDDGNLWFLSADDSHKNQELGRDPGVTLYFQGSQHSDFLVVSGRATISRDRGKIEELWEPIIKTWFTEGVNDPRITVIRVTPTHGYYWDTKHGNFVAGVKMMIGAAVGQTLDDSIEGSLEV